MGGEKKERRVKGKERRGTATHDSGLMPPNVESRAEGSLVALGSARTGLGRHPAPYWATTGETWRAGSAA